MKNRFTFLCIFLLSLFALWVFLSASKDIAAVDTIFYNNTIQIPEINPSHVEANTTHEDPTSGTPNVTIGVPQKEGEPVCELNEQEVPDWNDAFAAQFIAQHPEYGLTVKDMTIFKNLKSELLQLMWQPFSAFDQNEIVETDSPFKGQNLSQVKLAAEKGDAIAQALVGSHFMHRAYISRSSFDEAKYDEGQRLLLRATAQGSRDALVSLRLHALFAHRIIWRKSDHENLPLYQKLKGEYLALNELMYEHGTPAMVLAHLIDNDLISDQLSASGLSEPFPNAETLTIRDTLKSHYQPEMHFVPLTFEQQQDKDRLAWLVRNTNLAKFAEALDQACK